MEPITSLFRAPKPLAIGVRSGFAMSVLGPIATAELGVTLMHEHILRNFAPRLLDHGVTHKQLDTLMICNPKRVFSSSMTMVR